MKCLLPARQLLTPELLLIEMHNFMSDLIEVISLKLIQSIRKYLSNKNVGIFPPTKDLN